MITDSGTGASVVPREITLHGGFLRFGTPIGVASIVPNGMSLARFVSVSSHGGSRPYARRRVTRAREAVRLRRHETISQVPRLVP